MNEDVRQDKVEEARRRIASGFYDLDFVKAELEARLIEALTQAE